MVNHQRKEKLELLEHLLAKKADISLPILTQVCFFFQLLGIISSENNCCQLISIFCYSLFQGNTANMG